MSEGINKPGEGEQTQGFDYSKLEEIVSSRTEKVMNSIFKSFADENNLKLEELKEQYSKIQAGKTTEEIKETDTYKELLGQYETLQSTVKAEKLDNEIRKVSTEQGLTKEQADYVIKQLKTENLHKEDGTVNIEKITEEIKNVSQLFNIQLKGDIGYKGDDNNKQKEKSNQTNDEEQIRKMFGL